MPDLPPSVGRAAIQPGPPARTDTVILAGWRANGNATAGSYTQARGWTPPTPADPLIPPFRHYSAAPRERDRIVRP